MRFRSRAALWPTVVALAASALACRSIYYDEAAQSGQIVMSEVTSFDLSLGGR